MARSNTAIAEWAADADEETLARLGVSGPGITDIQLSRTNGGIRPDDPLPVRHVSTPTRRSLNRSPGGVPGSSGRSTIEAATLGTLAFRLGKDIFPAHAISAGQGLEHLQNIGELGRRAQGTWR